MLMKSNPEAAEAYLKQAQEAVENRYEHFTEDGRSLNPTTDHRQPTTSSVMNLETTYLGLSLKNPLIHSASPLSRKVEQHPEARRSRHRRHRPALPLRGADRRREPHARSGHARRAPALRRSLRLHAAATPRARSARRSTSSTSTPPRKPSTSPSSPPSTAPRSGGWTRYAKTHGGRRGRRHRAQPLQRPGRPRPELQRDRGDLPRGGARGLQHGRPSRWR